MKQFLTKPIIIIPLKFAITIGLLGGLLYYLNIEEIVASLSQAQPLLLLAGFFLVGANTGIHFFRWRYLLRLLSKNISNTDVLTSLLVGFTAGFFTPGQIGEIVGRIASHPDLRKSHVIGITIIDKAYIFAATVITGITSLAIFASIFFSEYWNSFYEIILVLFLLAFAIIFLFPAKLKMLLTMLPAKVRDHKLYSVISIIEEIFHNREARKVSFLSFSLYLVIVVQFYVFINAFEPVSFYDTAVSSLSVYFIKAVILPISIGDLGIRESASVFFFSKFGVSPVAAFNAALCMFLGNVLLPSIVGAFLVLRLKLK